MDNLQIFFSCGFSSSKAPLPQLLCLFWSFEELVELEVPVELEDWASDELAAGVVVLEAAGGLACPNKG